MAREIKRAWFTVTEHCNIIIFATLKKFKFKFKFKFNVFRLPAMYSTNNKLFTRNKGNAGSDIKSYK